MRSKRLIGFVILLLILGAIALYTLWPEWVSIEPVHDPARYREVINRLREQGDTNAPHFPPIIPASAKHVQFEYAPGHGTLNLQLQYDLPPDELADLVKRLQVPTTSPASAARWPQFISIPPEFSRLVLGVSDKSPGADNHDFGIAVDRANHRVIYWTEEW